MFPVRPYWSVHKLTVLTEFQSDLPQFRTFHKKTKIQEFRDKWDN